MKVKIKFDQKALLDFLLQHVEKIALGVFVLVFLLMVYGSLTSATRFKKTPEQLQSQASNSRREIEATSSTATGLVSADYAAQATRSRNPIAAKPYATVNVWDPAVFATRRRRGEPPLLTVQQLRGTAGLGPFRGVATSTSGRAVPIDAPEGAPANQGEPTQGKRWVVVTGLVPIEQQEQAYLDAFRTSIHYDSQKDSPLYYGYWVERVEVPENGGSSEPDWTKATTFVSKTAVDEALRQWGDTSQNVEVVAPQFLVPDFRLTFPLGPLVGRPWDATVAHEPEIPLANSNVDAGVNPDAEPRPPEKHAPTASPAAETPFGVLDPQHGGESRPAEVREQAALDENRSPAYRLFRFFDFSVQPGKRYRYRVRLALANPNYGLKSSLLAKPELSKEAFLQTAWSDPTPVIASARDVRLLAVSVKPATRAGAEPLGQILISNWLEKTGNDVFKEFSVVRGQLANFPGVDAKVATSGATEKADLITGSVIVDLRGGQPFLKRRDAQTAIGRILVLDAAGRLSVCDEANDLPLYKQLTTAAKEAAAAAAAAAEQRGLDDETQAKPSPKRRTKRPAFEP
ncbi:MAG: hypothetical protein ABFC77_12135 [Thermoguttaceae bacterium]